MLVTASAKHNVIVHQIRPISQYLEGKKSHEQYTVAILDFVRDFHNTENMKLAQGMVVSSSFGVFQ